MTPLSNFTSPTAELPLTAASASTAIPAVGDSRMDLSEPSDPHGTQRFRRLRYIARYLYWTLRHLSPKHAAWICAYEGLKW
jgi:hypothetical protein